MNYGDKINEILARHGIEWLTESPSMFFDCDDYYREPDKTMTGLDHVSIKEIAFILADELKLAVGFNYIGGWWEAKDMRPYSKTLGVWSTNKDRATAIIEAAQKVLNG